MQGFYWCLSKDFCPNLNPGVSYDYLVFGYMLSGDHTSCHVTMSNNIAHHQSLSGAAFLLSLTEVNEQQWPYQKAYFTEIMCTGG